MTTLGKLTKCDDQKKTTRVTPRITLLPSWWGRVVDQRLGRDRVLITMIDLGPFSTRYPTLSLCTKKPHHVSVDLRPYCNATMSDQESRSQDQLPGPGYAVVAVSSASLVVSSQSFLPRRLLTPAHPCKAHAAAPNDQQLLSSFSSHRCDKGGRSVGGDMDRRKEKVTCLF